MQTEKSQPKRESLAFRSDGRPTLNAKKRAEYSSQAPPLLADLPINRRTEHKSF